MSTHTNDEIPLADQLEQLLDDEVHRNATPLRRDVARRARAVAVPAASRVELDVAVVDAVTLAVDTSIERLLPGLVEEAVARALRDTFSTTLPLAIDTALPQALDAALPAAIDSVLPAAIDEAVTDLIEHMAPASPALDRATDAIRRLRARTAVAS